MDKKGTPILYVRLKKALYRIGVPFVSILTYGQYICSAKCTIIYASSPLSTISIFSSDYVWRNAPGTSYQCTKRFSLATITEVMNTDSFATVGEDASSLLV